MPRKDILKWLVLVMVNAVNAIDITYEQHAQFPKLFHLDDYNDCLGPIDGLYCVGTFHVRSLQDRDPVYELMKEYSLDFNNFNRTLLHRGYCVSSRCRSLSYIRNTTQRFERCAAYYAKRHSLRTMLTQFSYCRSHVEEYASKDISASVEMPHLMFLCILLIFLALNVIGTVYDVMKRDDNKSKLLTSWSVASNWSQLVGPYPDGDPRLIALLPVEAGRVIFLVIVVFVHSGCIHDTLYLANPKYVEEMAHHWITMPLQNGASTIQLFLILSSFLLAHSLIEMKELSFRVVPKVILKRLFRIVPVYALVIGFAATWWPLTREGPLWHSVVGAETQVCRRKFWAHMFFLHNFFEPERHCLVQTWFLAVDMQLNILGCIITVCLARSKRLALPVLGTAFVASVALTTCLAYINEWKPMMFVSSPENIRHMFQKERSFNEFYTSPLGSLPTMLVGLFLAHLHYQLQETGFKIADHKWIFYGCKMTMPLLLCWTTSGHLLRNFTSREFGAIYIGLERPVPVLMGGALIFGAYNGSTKKELKKITSAETTNGIGTKKPRVSSQGFLTRTFSWRIWYPLGRASLSAMMLHWCVNMMIKASTLQPLTSSALDMVADTLATTFLTYLLAIPITLCVEIPFIKVYSAITS